MHSLSNEKVLTEDFLSHVWRLNWNWACKCYILICSTLPQIVLNEAIKKGLNEIADVDHT